MREFREFVDIAFDAANEPAHLRKHFVDVGRNFRHRTRQDVDVIVAIHLKFAEFGPERGVARRGVGQHLRSRRVIRGERPADRIDAIEFILFLEFGHLALQSFFRKSQSVAQTLEFRDASEHARTVDDQLADGVHHAIEASQGNSHGLRRRCG